MSTAFKRPAARKTYRTEWVERWMPPKPLVGLEPDFVRFVARKAGYLADEKAHWQTVPIKVPVSSVPPEPGVSASSAPVHSITCHAHTHPSLVAALGVLARYYGYERSGPRTHRTAHRSVISP
ncbi:MAG: hypothetical protein AB7E59_13125 [Pusillimonas sp.]